MQKPSKYISDATIIVTQKISFFLLLIHDSFQFKCITSEDQNNDIFTVMVYWNIEICYSYKNRSNYIHDCGSIYRNFFINRKCLFIVSPTFLAHDIYKIYNTTQLCNVLSNLNYIPQGYQSRKIVFTCWILI